MANTCICMHIGGEVRKHPQCPIHGGHPLTDPVEKTSDTVELEAVKAVVKELTSKVQFLVEWLDDRGLLEDHCFTFPDGDVWKAQDIEDIQDV